MKNMRKVVATTYELAVGDRLEKLLTFDGIEALRLPRGRLGAAGTLPNLDALLRKDRKISIGSSIEKGLARHGHT